LLDLAYRYLQPIISMNYLSVEQLAKSFGVQTLFEGLSFGIEKGQKVALVARNGSGKSTLFKILTGKETPDSGLVVYNKEVRLGYLSQEHDLHLQKSIIENVFAADNQMTRAIKAYELAITTGHGLQEANDMMDQSQAWSYEAKAKQILGGLDIHDLEQKVAHLSGGQQRRIALARVLIEEPDLLLLDEPTNHLDLEMIEWLEEFLTRSSMTIFMITHDRYFLENITNEILEMENGEIFKYKGNFSYYLEKKAEREALEESTRDKQMNLFKRELEWARKMPRARTVKSKSRMDSFHELKTTVSKRIEQDELALEININRLGSKIIELHKVRKFFGNKPILNGFDYVFKTGERVGIVGKNGCGKSTFINMLTREMEPDGGKVVVGETVVFGHYSQSGMVIKDGQRIIEAIRDVADFIPLTKGKTISAAQMLERFMFPKSMHFNYVERLSGGERKRLQLLLLLMKNPNFLILDEPTNDLDVFTLAALEEYLIQYPGCLLIVSHDRYFMDKLVDHMLVMDGEGEIKDILGSYGEYRLAQELEEAKASDLRKAEVKEVAAAKAEKPKNKLSFKEKFELESIEKELPLLEIEKAELEAVLAGGTSDHEALLSTTDRLGKVMEELDFKSMRWLELTEYSGG
jgi:ABC transport system ATP-binding/permease protein